MAEQMDNTVLTAPEVVDLQSRLRQAIEATDAAIYSTAQELPSAYDRFSSAAENLLTFGVLKATKDRVLRLYQTTISNWESRKKILWDVVGTGKYEGRPITKTQERVFFQSASSSIDEARAAIGMVNEYAKGDVLTRAVRDSFAKPVEVLSRGFDTVVRLAGAAADVGEGAAKTVSTVGKLLPWIVGALILGPFLLRTFSASRKGGVTAAADTAAEELERGRRATGRAISTGARAVASRGMSFVR